MYGMVQGLIFVLRTEIDRRDINDDYRRALREALYALRDLCGYL
jgi:hypothetical protein